MSVEFFSENGTPLTNNYYKHGMFEYRLLDKPGFYRSVR